MSEFATCQNCGRRFFAENTECPYCRDAQIASELARASRPAAGGSRLYRILFSSFHMVLVGMAVLSLLAMRRTPIGPMRLVLGLEATGALAVLLGLVQRRRWGRLGAIAFIAANAGLGCLGLLQRGGGLAWGPGPLALLLFLLPFLTAQARARYDR
jgi:hypothetical protein